MKLTVTPQNIKHVLELFKKNFAGKGLDTQMFYPTAKRLNRMPLKRKQIEKSNKTLFKEFVAETDFMFGNKFIRVHNNLDVFGGEDEYSSRYRAFVIYCGDTVEFKNGIMNWKMFV